MRGALAIARRELGEKTFVLITAVVLSIMPFLVALIPSTRSFNTKTIIVTTGAFAAVGFSLGLAIILGATVIGRDLTERRLSFYFSRPVSPAAIWFGKMGASLLLVILSFAVLFGPAIAFGSDQWRSSWNVDLPLFTGCVFTAAIVLLLLTHAMSTMIRSRSPLVLVDFVLLVSSVLLLAAILLPLLSAFAFELSQWVAASVGIALVIALVAAGWYQLAQGRVERRQSHRALSTALWSMMAIILAAAGGFTLWVRSAKPSDLVTLGPAAQPSRGPWVTVGGKVRHRLDYQPMFLINTEDGSSRHVGGAYRLGLGTFFSPDGQSLGWVEKSSLTSNRFQLVVLPLTPGAEPIETGIAVQPFSDAFFSDDGSRLATMDYRGGTISIHDWAAHKLVGSFRMPPAESRSRYWLFFDGRDRLRLIDVIDTDTKLTNGPTDHVIRIFEFDVARKVLAQTGEAHVMARHVGMNGNADGSRLLIRSYGAPGEVASNRLIDGRTAATIAPFEIAKAIGGMYRILTDGTIVISTHDATGSTMRVYDPAGSLQRELPLPGYPRINSIGEIAPGRLLVDAYRGDESEKMKQARWTAMVIDVKSGKIVQQQPGLASITGDWASGFARDPRRSIMTSPPLFFADAKLALISWNPTTGARRTIAE